MVFIFKMVRQNINVDFAELVESSMQKLLLELRRKWDGFSEVLSTMLNRHRGLYEYKGEHI